MQNYDKLAQTKEQYSQIWQNIKTSQTSLHSFIRKSFSMPKKLNRNILQSWKLIIDNSPLVLLYIIDSTFFKSLAQQQKASTIIFRNFKNTAQMTQLRKVVARKINLLDRICFEFKEQVINKQLFQKFKNTPKKNYSKEIQLIFENLVKGIKNIFTYANELETSISIPMIKIQNNSFHQQDILIKTYVICKVFQRSQALDKLEELNQEKHIFLVPFQVKIMIEKIIGHLEIAKLKIQKLNASSNEEELQKIKISERINQQFIDRLEVQSVPQVNCLNCIRFFYQKLQISKEISTLTDFEVAGSVRSIKQSSHKILQVVCSFLNQGRGTLFFDCHSQMFGFQPIGHQMSLKEKEGYKFSFMYLINYIQPAKYWKHLNIEIDFIPIVQSPFKYETKLNQSSNQSKLKKKSSQQNLKKKRRQIDNLYVMRVRILSQKEKLLFSCIIDKKSYFYSRKNSFCIQIKNQEIYMQMKQKYLKSIDIADHSILKRIQYISSDLAYFSQLICGRRIFLQNQHEGKCLEMLIQWYQQR